LFYYTKRKISGRWKNGEVFFIASKNISQYAVVFSAILARKPQSLSAKFSLRFGQASHLS